MWRILVAAKCPMRFDVLTLFPGAFAGYLSQSLLCKAIERGLVEVHLHDLRNWSKDKRRTVDDRPFGGGPGMVIRVDIAVESVEDVQTLAREPGHVVLLSPQGRRLNQQLVQQLAQRERLILLCGRYEGFDQRVTDILQPEEISIGDYILNGGEVAAMVVIDAVMRLVPGVLGEEQSLHEDSFSSRPPLLECGHYTRPRDYRGHRVPDVLLSGDHDKIARWRREQGWKKTAQRRADLLERSEDENE